LETYGFSEGREGVESLLRLLADEKGDLKRRYKDLVVRLDDDEFVVREKATLELARLPFVDRVALKNLQKEMPPEAAMRIAWALKSNSPGRFDDMIEEVLNVIIDAEMKGLCSELFLALGNSVEYRRGVIWALIVDAVRVTVRKEDLPVLTKGIESEAALVRGAAASALLRIDAKAGVEALLKVVDDPDDNVKWIVAEQLVQARRREALKPMADLLMSSDFGLRQRASRVLREVTEQEFDYYSAGEEGERAGPAKQWRDWIEREAEGADLNFGEEAEEELPDGATSLFDGESLDGWTEWVDEFRGEAAKRGTLFSSWRVDEDGVRCLGLHAGSLRSDAAFGDFVLSADYLLPDRDSSAGVGVLVGDLTAGFLEVELKHGSSGDLYQLGDLDLVHDDGTPVGLRALKIAKSNEKADDWNSLEIEVSDGAVIVRINGLEQNRLQGAPKRPLGLLFRDTGMPAEFRNIRLRKL
jgi:hypothetical protein